MSTVVEIEKSKDGYLLSGDYSNSTDYIPCEFTKVIYDQILCRVPSIKMKEIVEKSLDEAVYYSDIDKSVELVSGQMMGGLLSFPALCIMNHCISKYLGIKDQKKKN